METITAVNDGGIDIKARTPEGIKEFRPTKHKRPSVSFEVLPSL
jgi:hypothetical protein